MPRYFQDRILHGDNLELLEGLESQSIDLIYLDPPFNSNATYTAKDYTPAAGASFKDSFGAWDVDYCGISKIEEECPKLAALIKMSFTFDIAGLDTYLMFMGNRLIECRRVLKDTGSIYLHCNVAASHYIKMLMDCIFGSDNFRNEIVWSIEKLSKTFVRWVPQGDRIFFYTVTSEYTFNPQTRPHKDLSRYDCGFTKTVNHGKKKLIVYDENKPGVKDHIADYEAKGHRIVYKDKLTPIVMGSVWTDISFVTGGKQYTGYPTQKPEALLARIIKASSNEGDVVLDPFCGSGTTCAAAKQLGRRYIGLDRSEDAVKIAMSRCE